MSARTGVITPAASLILALVLLLGAPFAAGSERSGSTDRSQAEPGPIGECGEIPVDGVDDALFARVVLRGSELAIHAIDPERGQAVCRLPYGSTALSPDGRTIFLGRQTLADGRMVTEVMVVERATGAIRRVYDVMSEPASDAAADRLPSPALALAPDGRLLHILAIVRVGSASGAEAETTWSADLLSLDLEVGQVTGSVRVAEPVQAFRYWPELIAAPDGAALYVVERIFTANDQTSSEEWEDQLSLVRSTTIRTDTLAIEHVATGALASKDAGGAARFANCGLGYESPFSATPEGLALYSFCQGGLYHLAVEPLPAIVRFFDPRTLKETSRIEVTDPSAPVDATVAVPSRDGTLLYVVGATEEERSIQVVDLARASVVRSAVLTPPGDEQGQVGRLTAWLGRALAPQAAAKGLWPTIELAPDGRSLFVAAGETGIWEVDSAVLRVTRVFGTGAQHLDLAFSASGAVLVALDGKYDLTIFPAGEDIGRSVENGLKGEALFNEVLFP